MTFSEDLLKHTLSLLSRTDGRNPDDISKRRAVSSAYYALFHRLNSDAVSLIAPNVTTFVNHRIQRWFDHAEMKRICGRFLRQTLDQPLLSLLGRSASPDMQTVCRTFVDLQEARHSADYDLSFSLTWRQAAEHVEAAFQTIEAWERVATSAEANIFILSLLLWKNWDSERL